ncbi:GNAT family N-acetyltransferase [Thalassospira sp. MA62]|nr:GNAT family N-acetyltransferase [Thalassospira sp. MA62]
MPADTPIKVRLATRADAPAMHEMLYELAVIVGSEDKFKSTPDDIARDGFGPTPAFEAMIAVDAADRAVGLCLYFPSYSTFRGKAGIYIQDLYVSPDYRGNGFARDFVKIVARHARDTGKAYIRLSVAVDNLIGQRFYEKLGMRHADDEKIYILDGAALNALTQE